MSLHGRLLLKVVLILDVLFEHYYDCVIDQWSITLLLLVEIPTLFGCVFVFLSCL